MASSLRFSQKERDYLRRVIAEAEGAEPGKIGEGVLEKLERSELTGTKKSTPGIGWQRAANAMREVLGKSLALPPRPTEQWMAWMSQRIKMLGLSEADCRSIAKVVQAKGWRPPISFETLIKGADRHLSEAQMPLPAVTSTPSRSGWTAPTEVDDE